MFAVLLPAQAFAGPALVAHGGVTTLNVWGHFAELATALGLAYANLPNFRYRDKLRQYVLRMLEDSGFKKNFQACCDTHPTPAEIGILIKLGRLTAGDGLHKEFKPEIADGTERWWSGNNDVLIFRNLFSNNLDKIVCVCLAVVAAWMLWFGAIDEARFPQTFPNDPHRDTFLVGALCGIALTLFLALIAYLIFLAKNNAKRFGWAFVALGCLVFVSASVGSFPLVSVWRPYFGDVEYNSHVIFGAYLFVANAIPVLLVLLGDWARARMAVMADEARKTIAAQRVAGVDRADFTPPPAHQPENPDHHPAK